ncbi:MAG: signal peptidase II [Magnetococcales bacterium]|nr:signal peptidase II [Magnetococcales bacterium]HAT39594.1 signal peptidase II [Polynucleobacter sp.]MBF0149327.1 signal peptidase II [Magnetococcales bacterium]MBF0174567.1 signal peptidase II [Magnetococcales bacterium]MBF0347530.1 signal peptidase II [Magnetococcales bacterium]
MKPWGGDQRGLLIGIPLALLVFVADQVSKWLAVVQLADGRRIVLWEHFFDLVLVYNVGAAFGMFQNLAALWRNFILGGIALGAVVAIVIILGRTTGLWLIGGMACILGGALGNLVDRVRLGKVVDFLHVHWHDLSWPVFNLADSAISLGVAMLLLDYFLNEEKGN